MLGSTGRKEVCGYLHNERVTAGKWGEQLTGGSAGARGRPPKAPAGAESGRRVQEMRRRRLTAAGTGAQRVPNLPPTVPSACRPSEPALVHQNPAWDSVPCRVVTAKPGMAQNERSTGQTG